MRIILLLLLTIQLFSAQRIIALTPAISEIIFALNKEDALIGVNKYASYPKEVQKINKVGDYFSLNLEYILSLEPTLLITQNNQSKTIKSLQKFNIKILSVNLDTIKDIKNSIMKIAKATQSTKRAKKIIADINKAIFNVKKIKNKERVLVVFGLNSDLTHGIFIASGDVYFNEILTLCGAQNAYQGSFASVPKLSYENIIALNPQRVIILDASKSTASKESKQAIKIWKKLPIDASKNSKIIHLDEDYITMPSHRIALSIEKFSKVINDD